MVYLTTPVDLLMVGREMNWGGGDKKIWKEVVVANSRYYSGIHLEGLRKTKKNFRTAGIVAEIRASPESKNRSLVLAQNIRFKIL
jgi:hypothetical protein